MLPAGKCDLGTIIVDVEDITKDPSFGRLLLLSCEEPLLSYIDRLYEDFQEGDEATLERHVNLILSTEIDFRHFKSKAERDLFVIIKDKQPLDIGQASRINTATVLVTLEP